MTKTRKIVLDTAPFINNTPLYGLADEFYTIPEVIAEIRDIQARQHLQNSLVDVKVRNPDQESLDFVIDFSKKTGDYSVLSLTDLKILALSYLIEKETNGVERIRSAPLPPKINSGERKKDNKKSLGQLSASQSQAEGAANAENKSILNVPAVDENIDANEQENQEENKKEEINKEKIEGFVENAESDDEEGWITPQNIKAVEPQSNKKNKKKSWNVACMTSDFAMQNVLLQMNLALLSLDGVRISKLKTYVLRCYACFKYYHMLC